MATIQFWVGVFKDHSVRFTQLIEERSATIKAAMPLTLDAAVIEPHCLQVESLIEPIGAKQNRVANLTLLISAATTTTIPVSCVEQDRWSFQSDEFALSEGFALARDVYRMRGRPATD